jgi:hypothetical protein
MEFPKNSPTDSQKITNGAFFSTIATTYQQVLNRLTKDLRNERMPKKRFPTPTSVKYLVHF